MSDLELLGLGPTAGKKEIKEAWKRLAKLHHPDIGGDAAIFVAIKAAYERLAKPKIGTRLKIIVPCKACQGSGIRYVLQGLNRNLEVCKTCKGSGKVSKTVK